MKYKMIAVDMDGTLLNSNHEITPRTKTAIIQAVENGAIFVTSTGRAMAGVEFVNDLFQINLPFIIFNGASVVMGKSREVLFNRFLEVELAAEAFELGKKRNLPMVLWTEANLYTNIECAKINEYFKRYGYVSRFIDSVDEVAQERVYKLFWLDTPEQNAINRAEMTSHFKGRLNCFTSLPEYLEFVSINAGKGSALQAIGSMYNIDRSEIIAVGDGFNDIEMLEYAGLGVAMENAHDEVKAFSQYITLSNNDEGVAAVIEKYLL